MTSDLSRRAFEHLSKQQDGFSARYSVSKLVWAEAFDGIADAIAREKQLKAWNRAWKIALIEEANPDWRDLFELGGG